MIRHRLALRRGRPVAETSLSIVYLGAAVDDGRMEVGEVAPALLALADLFREINQIANPDAPALSLKIQAADHGSFEIELVAQLPDFVDRLVEALTGDAAEALEPAVNLVVGIGTVLGTTGWGLFHLIKWLRGRRIVERNHETEEVVRLVLDDGTEISIPARLLEAHDSITVRRRTREVVLPLDREGVDEMQFRDHTGEITVSVGADDRAAFEVSSGEAVEIFDSEHDMVVTITAVDFKGDNKWRLSDGASTFPAAVADTSFLDRVATREESFAAGDRLDCRMRIRHWQDDEGPHTEHTVLHVRDHIRATPMDLHRLFDLEDDPPSEGSN